MVALSCISNILRMQAFLFKELEILVAVNDLPILIVVLESSVLYQGLELEFSLVVHLFHVFLANPSKIPFYCYTPKTLIQSLNWFWTCLNIIAFSLF